MIDARAERALDLGKPLDVSSAEYEDKEDVKLRAKFGIWCAEDPVARLEKYEGATPPVNPSS